MDDLDKRLRSAVWDDDVEEANQALLLGADVNHIDSDGNTPLHLAVEQCSFEMVELLLASGADVDARGQSGYWTPLIHAADSVSDAAIQLSQPADNRIIRLLLDHGANVHAESPLGTALQHMKAHYLNREAEEMLREAGAK